MCDRRGGGAAAALQSLFRVCLGCFEMTLIWISVL